MIKVNELRIGNHILLFNEHIGIVTAIENNGGIPLIWTENSHNVTVDRRIGDRFPLTPWMGKDPTVTGIILTAKILEKCGFEYGHTNERGVTEGPKMWSLQIANDNYLEFSEVHGVDAYTKKPTYWHEWRIVSEFSSIRGDFWNQPAYLHQLQNLCFALTGEELTVKL